MNWSYRSWFRVLPVAALVVASAQSAAADGRTDFYYQQTLRRYLAQSQNARTFGMAGSSIQTSTDSSSVIGNPAGLGKMSGGDMSLSYGHNTISGHEDPSYDRIEETSNSGSALAAIPLGPTADGLPLWGNFGLGWTGYNGDWKDSNDTNTRGNTVTGAYSKALMDDKLSLGYSLQYTQDHLGSQVYTDTMTDGFLHSAGANYKVNEKSTLGSTLRIGHGSRDIEQGGPAGDNSADLFQAGLDVGADYRMDRLLLATSVGYDFYHGDYDSTLVNPGIPISYDNNRHVMNARVGAEYQIVKWLKARAGYRYAANFDYDEGRPEVQQIEGSAKYNGWSAGVGASWPIEKGLITAVNLDYGVEYRPVGDDDWQHIVTLSAPMDFCR